MSSYENNNGVLTPINGCIPIREIEEIALDTAGTLVAPIEKTSTASQAYAVGKQFVYNGLLTEATSAIAQGATITVGSGGNAKLADCVSDQIASLKASLDVQDISSNLSCPNGTFAIKQVHVILDSLVVIAFEINTTSTLTGGGQIIKGFPQAKGNYINVVFNAGGTVRGGYTDNQVLALGNGSISSGTTVAGNFSYIKA